MVEFVNNINIIFCQPEVVYVNAIVADAVRLFRWHTIDILRQYVLNMLQFGIVLITGQFFVYGSEVDKGTLVIRHFIAVYGRSVRGIKKAPLVQFEIIILPFDNLDRTYSKKQVLAAIRIILQARLETGRDGQDRDGK